MVSWFALAGVSGTAYAQETTAVAAVPSAQAAEPAPHDDASSIADIIVTAQRRAENLQRAALSVSAVTGDALVANRIYDVEALSHFVPGLFFTQAAPDSREINIRGVVTAGIAGPSADPSVAVFVDDVYVGRTNILNYNFYDTERVEVVRGPQGVLLGKNVAGGAINVLSRAPTGELEGGLSAALGNYDLRQLNFNVAGPVGGGLAARLSGQSITHSGYARDILHNTDLESLDSQQVRLQLATLPGSDFAARLILDYSREKSDGINRVGVLNPDAPPSFDIWASARAQIAALRGGLGPRESLPVWPTFAGQTEATPQGSNLQLFSAILRLEKDVANDVRATSITGFRHGNARTLWDQTGLAIGNPYGVVTPLLFSEPVFIRETSDQFSQELRLTSSYTGRFNWLVGAYYLKSRVRNRSRLWGESTVLPQLSGESFFDDTAHIQTYAAFGQLSFNFTPQLRLDAGARYTRDEKDGHVSGTAVRTSSIVPGVPLTPLAVVPGFSTGHADSWEKLTPQATLRWTPTDRLMAYATLSVGFKGGGFQGVPESAAAAVIPYNPETVTNYEIGVKAELFDRRVRWNSSFFIMKYRDLQVQQTNAACLCNIISNAAKATIKGVETELLVAPVRQLNLWANGTVLDAHYDRYVIGAVDNTGNFLQRTPRYQLTVGGQVAVDLGSWRQALSFMLNYSVRGRMEWEPANGSHEPGYGLLNGRIALTPPDRPWSIAVFGRNITDKLYRVNVIPFLQDDMSSYGPPRTFGAELTTKF